jgi:hypothetical protein
MKATASFTNVRYEEEPYGDAEGAKLERVHISRTFAGELEGESTAELLTAQTEDGGAGYLGHDSIRGALAGKQGSFVLQHGGTISPSGSSISGVIVPGSATGDLEGLTGEGTIEVDAEGNHMLTLEYELGPR